MRRATVPALSTARLVALLGAASAIAASPSRAPAATLHVPGDHPTIQRAVNAARPGDVIRVAPATYRESIRIVGAKAGLVIEAADEHAPPVIRGTRNKSADGIRVDLVDGIGLRNLRIEGAYNGVRLNYVEGATLVGLVLVDNALGIRVNHGRDNTVLRCVVVGARVEQGIRVDHSPGTTVADTAVTRTDREGIRVLGSPDVVLDRNHVTAARGSDGIKVDGSPRATVTRCTAEDSYRDGIRVAGSHGLALAGNVATRNRSVGVRIEHSAPFRSVADVVAAGNHATGNRTANVLVEPPRCNVDVCPGTPTTTPTTTGAPPTTVPQPGVAAAWRFYVRIAIAGGGAVNVHVPVQSVLPPIPAAIRADHLPAFRIGDQMTAAEIADLGGDTLARLVVAADAHIRAAPLAYRGFDGVVALVWAKRVE